MMKRFFLCLGTFAASLAFVSCTEENLEDPDKPDNPAGRVEITVSPETVEAKSAGGDYFLTVISDGNVSVSYDTDAGWFSAGLLVGAEENNLRFRVEPNTGNKPRSSEVTLSADGADDVTVTLTQQGTISSVCELLSFSIAGKHNGLESEIEFELDPDSRTLNAMYLKWIEKDDPEMLIPEFTINGAKVLVNGVEVVSGETEISFADDFILTVEAENGDTKDYTVSLNCPQINRELAVLHFKPASEIVSKDDYVDTKIELYDKTPGSTGEGWWDSDEQGTVEMRGRGNSTWGLPKKPYRIKFPDKFSPIGLDHAKEKSWTLLAQDMDKSLLRTHLAFEYSRALFDPSDNYHDSKAILFTPASKYVNVYITGWYTDSSTGERRFRDGEYLGVYQMSDQVQEAEGRIAVDKIKADDVTDPVGITGGYIIETDIHEGNWYSPHKNVKMSYKYPEDDEEDYDPGICYDYITDFIGDFENILYGSDFKNPENGWRKYLDEKTLIDFIIIKELAADMDGYTSTYMYKRRGVDKLFFGPIWDCDKGWDNDKRREHGDPLSSLIIYSGFWMPNYIENDWFQRLWEDETFRIDVASRWDSKRDELMAVTYRVLEEVPASMPKAIEANFTVWPFYYQYSSEANMPAEDYSSEIERIRDLTEKRAVLLDNLFNK